MKGKKLGLNDERNFLFREYLKIVETIQPDFIVMENVKALVNTANGYFLEQIESELKRLGLQPKIKVLNARNFGVPQNRERVFIVAMRKQAFDFNRLPETSKASITVRDAISDLHFLASGKGEFEQDFRLPKSSEYQCEMRQNAKKLFNHQATNHSKIALDKLKMIPPEGDKSSLPKELHGKQQFVHHIITDPPYSISAENQFHTMKNPRQGVNFGEWDRNFDPTAWLDVAFPILDINGSLIIFCSYKFISHIGNKVEQLGGVVKDILVWQKANPMPRNINRRYVQDMEFAIWAVKSKRSKWVFNKPDGVPYQRAFFKTPTLLGKERTAHPTQKPVSLMKDIIQIHTNSNELIFDPFMGVGSTGVASLILERQFIGCEREKDWFELARQRLVNLNLFQII